MAELPHKQSHCPRWEGDQIRFYPHYACFEPSTEQQQARLELVVREYVRYPEDGHEAACLKVRGRSSGSAQLIRERRCPASSQV